MKVERNPTFLHQIVFKAREQPLKSIPDTFNSTKTSLNDVSISCDSSIFGILENPLKCPLDLSSLQRHDDQMLELPVLLKKVNSRELSINTEIVVPFNISQKLIYFHRQKNLKLRILIKLIFFYRPFNDCNY